MATAPSGVDGHVNLSPKGLDGLRVLGPLMTDESDRRALPAWAEKKGPVEIESYWAERNAANIEGLPAV